MAVTQQTDTQSLPNFLEQSSFLRIKNLICQLTGVDCSGYRDEYLKRRFEIRLRATGCSTYGKYVIYLKRNPEEVTNLLNAITVNYTTFFRDNDVYTYLEKKLLPKLFQSQSQVRIWSAGCATGEEPYSLAILVQKLLEKSSRAQLVKIYASDIDKDALSKAEAGNYQKRQLNTLDQALIEHFFNVEGEVCTVKDFVKKMVRFEQADLMKNPQRHNLDLVLCRNVMIYFSKESQQQIHMSFYNALRDGGYLITGKSEILSGEPAKRFIPTDNQFRVYQKPTQQLFK